MAIKLLFKNSDREILIIHLHQGRRELFRSLPGTASRSGSGRKSKRDVYYTSTFEQPATSLLRIQEVRERLLMS